MKTYIISILSFFLFLNCNYSSMNAQDCFSLEKFDQLKVYITKHHSTIKLSTRLIADRETISKEIQFQDRYIELVESPDMDMIIIIDQSQILPTYFCRKEDNKLKFSAYASRFDTDEDVANRKKDWCQLLEALLNKK